MIEGIKYQVHTEEEKTREILHAENIKEHLCALSEELFKKEMEVGSGNFSWVYRDPEAGLVYKKMKPTQKSKNDVHEEAEFMSKLSGVSSEVKVPLPVVSFIADLKREKDSRPVRQSVLVMEEIKGFSMDKMFPDASGREPKVPFPKTFNADIFFPALKKFIEKMHSEYNIYHRDLFDRNIMIDEETGMPVVIDFGDAVEWDASIAEIGETDAYGRPIVEDTAGNRLIREDKDLEHVKGIEERVRMYQKLT